MQRDELEYGVTLIVRDLVEDDGFVATTNMTTADLPGWDSFTQVEFVTALESRFGVELPLTDVETWRNLGDALASVADRIGTTGT